MTSASASPLRRDRWSTGLYHASTVQSAPRRKPTRRHTRDIFIPGQIRHPGKKQPELAELRSRRSQRSGTPSPTLQLDSARCVRRVSLLHTQEQTRACRRSTRAYMDAIDGLKDICRFGQLRTFQIRHLVAHVSPLQPIPSSKMWTRPRLLLTYVRASQIMSAIAC